MSDPALNPSERTPGGATVRRRWFPTLAGGALLAVVLLGLGWKTKQFFELRRENESLRAASASLDQLRQDNAELLRLRAAAEQAGRAQKEQEELVQLRAEVVSLRAVAQEIPALRAESQRLQTERATAAARAGVVAEEDPFAEAKARAQRINCISNLKQIGLAARIWAEDHNLILPSNFQTMSNQLSSPKILTCSGDTARQRANDWREFDGSGVSYEIVSPGADIHFPHVVYVRCLIHQNVGSVDGSAQMLGPNDRIEKVDGKFKIVRAAIPTTPAPP